MKNLLANPWFEWLLWMLAYLVGLSIILLLVDGVLRLEIMGAYSWACIALLSYLLTVYRRNHHEKKAYGWSSSYTDRPRRSD